MFYPDRGYSTEFCSQVFASLEVTQLAVRVSAETLLGYQTQKSYLRELCQRFSPRQGLLYGIFVLQLFAQTRVNQLAVHFPFGIAT